MPVFAIRDVFEIPSRRLFVLSGQIAEGEIRAGMSVTIDGLAVPISNLEFSRRPGGEDLCLCLQPDEDALTILRSLNLSGRSALVF